LKQTYDSVLKTVA